METKKYILKVPAVVKAFNEIIFDAPQGALIEVTKLNRVQVWVDGKLMLDEYKYDIYPRPSFIFFDRRKVVPYCLTNNGLEYLEALNLVERIDHESQDI